jgi:hypothetical protein
MDEQPDIEAPPVGSLKLERIVLIVDSPEAQRLVATWYMAWERYADQLTNSQDTGDELSPEFRESWARIARCDIDDVDNLIPVLFENELLLSEGAVATEALRYVQARMVDALQKPPR